ncbi:MAG: radical SAM family heme chaperone HemW [Clostridia bacterium]|nr:radical SAM family heme chaperone HemW [Clostridia bacterium]MBQ7122929.1 radical SAM family heme chaperone HemW [Clostridia bacterium]
MNPIGLYIHIPFCNGKCPYCDFYSVTPQDETVKSYVLAICKKLDKTDRIYDTVYFGGGTPSLIGSDNIAKIMSHIIRTPDCEATLECNPSDTGAINSVFDFDIVAKSGINRISMGLQSAVDVERQALGRRGGCDDVERAIKRVKRAGIDNISLDLMLGIPNQTEESLKKSIDFCKSSGAKHVSAYILKIEENTPFYRIKDKLSLPDEDETCDLYLYAVSELEKSGFYQYEISNFSQKGFESRHNLKYWHCEEYLGIGASAHSFTDGKRFYYERSIDGFIREKPPVDDGFGGDEEEYIMLALRLSEGLIFGEFEKRFNKPLSENIILKAKELEKHKLIKVTDKSISLTSEGFLVSNSVIYELIK